jgi:hypothetical protein
VVRICACAIPLYMLITFTIDSYNTHRKTIAYPLIHLITVHNRSMGIGSEQASSPGTQRRHLLRSRRYHKVGAAITKLELLSRA